MNVRISRAVLDAIQAQLQLAGDDECCGLLLAEPRSPDTHVDAILPAANVAADRSIRFEIDPATLIRAHRAEREGHRRIVGCYHSHPAGNPDPSAEDARQAQDNHWLWLICTPSPWQVAVWRAVPAGARYGRFDPVHIESEQAT